MDDLISRQQVFDALRTCYDTETITMDNGDEYISYYDAVGEIEQLPFIQPEHKTGQWIYRKELSKHGDMWSCSECNEKTTVSVMGKPRHNFCPLCGADMRGETNE